MYSRSFYNEQDNPARPPENYGGNAFTEVREETEARIGEPCEETSAVL